MTPAQLQAGIAYYRLTFADVACTIPGVEPMIYIGTNVFPDDDPATVIYYFQDTVSHLWRGPATDSAHDSKHPEIETAVYPHTEKDVQSDILTLSQVISALTEALRRTEGRH